MFRNNVKIALRNLIRNKTSAFINIGGLAVGMAVAMAIGLWIYDELSYNRWHKNYERIAEVKSNANYAGEIFTIDSHPMPLGTAIRSAGGSDFKYVVMSTHMEQHVLSVDARQFNEQGNYMQPEATEMLSLDMIIGSRKALSSPGSIMLSASVARKLFDSEDPINRILRIDNKFPVTVMGIYRDLPDNSSFKSLGFIAPFDLYLASYEWAQKKYTDWNNIAINIYTQLNPGVDLQKASARIRNMLAEHVSGDFAKRKPLLFLQPMSGWHLYSKFENGVNVMSDELRFIRLYAIIGGFVLLLACINFMNLSTARSEKRAREVGVRKAIGSARSQLIYLFYAESMTVTFFAYLLAICLVQLSLPWFNEVAAKNISIPWNHPFFWITGLGFIVLTALLAGSYPALYLSSFKPVKVLKGTFRGGKLAAIPRKALVLLQFTVSILLIIGTMIVYRQIRFGKDRPVGYQAESLLQVSMNSPEYEGKYELIRNELKNTGVVSEIAESASPLTSIWSTNRGFSWRGMENTKDIEFASIAVTADYGKTIGWQFMEGRDFSRQLSTDSTGFVINKAAAKLMGMQNPVGETMEWEGIKEKHFRILGVVRDMVMESPFAAPYPTIFFIYQRDGMNRLLVRINPKSGASQALGKIEAVIRRIIPAAPFEYAFVNDEFNRKFEAEERISKLAGVFSMLAILISCLGLFGLASFVAEQRTKEIGVRKVLGASVFNLWRLLTREFMLLILMALAIAGPVGYFLMKNWLQNYQYRIGIGWWIFAVAGGTAMLITLVTVSFQSIHAALKNPVKSLRTE